MNEQDKIKLEFLTKAINNLNACFPELPFFITLEPKTNVVSSYQEDDKIGHHLQMIVLSLS